jgi:PAS domain S-box-containing protein
MAYRFNSQRTRGFGTPSYGVSLWRSLAIIAPLFLSTAARAQQLSTSNTSPNVIQAQVHRRTVKVPVIEGTDIRFRRLSPAAGLSQTRVEQIVQGNQGFMWFGTQFGLNRYDGHNFRVFTPNPTSANSISGGYIYSLFKDRSNMFWIGCNQSLDRYDPTTDSFTHYRLSSNDSDGVAITALSIVQDRSGTLWLGTGSGLYGLDPTTARITNYYTHDPRDSSTLNANEIEAIIVDRSGRLLVADGNDLEQVDQKTGKVIWRLPLPGLRNIFNSIPAGLDGMPGVSHPSIPLWIDYTKNWQDGGFALLDLEAGELTYYSFYDQKSGNTLHLSVSAMLKDTSGSFWLGGNGGLLRLEPKAERAIRYRHHTDDPESLDDDRVIALEQDREGNIWVGLHAREPNVFTTRKPSFTPILRESLARNPLGEYMVSAIYEDRSGTLWVGASGNLIRTDRETGKCTSYPLNDDVISISGDSAGAIWVGTGYTGFYRFDPQTSRFKRFPLNPSSPPAYHNQILRIFIDGTGEMWLATRRGLLRFNGATGRFTVYQRHVNQIDEYFDIAEDQNGRLWLGGNAGLQRYDPATREFARYEHQLGNPRSLSDNTVSSVLVDHSGNVWAATYNGLAKLDQKTGTFTNYYANDGLPSSRVSCVLEDGHGALWMSTARGVSRFDPVARAFKNYSIADGLPGMDLTGWVTCFRSPSGEMFFGGFSGATAFFPDKVIDRSYVPPVIFTDFLLSGNTVAVGGGSPLQKSINYTDRLTLSHKQNNFSLQFAALGYSSPSLYRYRYRLESLDSQWNEIAADRYVNYSNLVPGKYTFRVQASTGQGTWNAPGAVLYIEILPPWWKTWWFRMISLVAGLALIWQLYQLRIRQLRRQEAKLRNVIETIPTFAWTALPSGSVDFINHHWVKFTGLSSERTIGSGWQEAVHPEDLRPQAEKWQACMKSGEPFECEVRYRGAVDGQYRWFLSRAVPLRDVRGKIVKWYGTSTDIEDRKRAEQLQADLAHVNRVSTLGEMAASLAHEIKQPIAAAITSANSCIEWLTHEPPNLDRARAAASRIDKYGNRAAEIIDRMRSFYRKSPPQRELVDVNEIICEILTLLKGQATGCSVTMQTELAIGFPKAMADRVQLQQVFMNLLLNAIEAMKDSGGELTVKSVLQNGQFQFSVSDSGVGLPTEVMDQIFSAFFTTKAQGSGMGLAISRSIVESHGGRLWATANDGRGATFHFTLPIKFTESLPLVT